MGKIKAADILMSVQVISYQMNLLYTSKNWWFSEVLDFGIPDEGLRCYSHCILQAGYTPGHFCDELKGQSENTEAKRN